MAENKNRREISLKEIYKELLKEYEETKAIEIALDIITGGLFSGVESPDRERIIKEAIEKVR